ncbi:hypothetical protein A9Q89_04490 [Gammaproteobacteria bacterium 53_120_T64]|nr:hypothetical protein A9Q89_04490 [Gammaproteobacteria bacterium 53_120_T64]
MLGIFFIHAAEKSQKFRAHQATSILARCKESVIFDKVNKDGNLNTRIIPFLIGMIKINGMSVYSLWALIQDDTQ